MKFKMAPNSLFAVLLRSPWWASLSLAVALGAVATALMPDEYRVMAALAGFPFAVIAAMAAWRGRGKPSEARVAHTAKVLGAMAWPAFAALLESAFRRDGFSVQRGPGPAWDFELQRQGRRMLVSARRWKSARQGLEPLKALQEARDAAEAPDALFIALGEFSEPAAQWAQQHRVAVWRAPELAQKLRGLLP